MLSSLDERLAAEREQAARALLMSPLLTDERDRESFTLVRRHGDWLSERFRHLLGYRLAIRGEHARLSKRPRTAYRDRPARIRPASTQPGPEDTWAPFTRRHYVLLALALATLEAHQGRSQANSASRLSVERVGKRTSVSRREPSTSADPSARRSACRPVNASSSGSSR